MAIWLIASVIVPAKRTEIAQPLKFSEFGAHRVIQRELDRWPIR